MVHGRSIATHKTNKNILMRLQHSINFPNLNGAIMIDSNYLVFIRPEIIPYLQSVEIYGIEKIKDSDCLVCSKVHPSSLLPRFVFGFLEGLNKENREKRRRMNLRADQAIRIFYFFYSVYLNRLQIGNNFWPNKYKIIG